MGSVDRFRQGEEDLLSIAEFIARDKPTAALRWLDDIEAVLKLIAQQPYMGEAVNHIGPVLRRVTHGNYAIYYEPRDAGFFSFVYCTGRERSKTFSDSDSKVLGSVHTTACAGYLCISRSTSSI